MPWWKISRCDSKILQEVKKYSHVVYDVVDGVVDEIEHWLGKDSDHIVITRDIPIIKKQEPLVSKRLAEMPIVKRRTDHTEALSHKSSHYPQIIKTADPFVEGGLINTGLLIDDLMHNLPTHVPRNDHTKRALLSIILMHLQHRHTSPGKGKHNWVSFAKELGDSELHNKEIERAIVDSIMQMAGSEDEILHQNRPVLTPEQSAARDRKYWQRQVIGQVLGDMGRIK